MNENNQQHTSTTPTGSWGVITEVDNGFNGEPEQSELMKAARMALEALEYYDKPRDEYSAKTAREQDTKAITALRTAIEAAEKQEPVAYIHRQGNHWEVSERLLCEDEKARGWTEEPLYTTPPAAQPDMAWVERERAVGYREGHMAALAQRQWVSLTDEDFGLEKSATFRAGAVWADAKLREKNGGQS